jgi:hypothetical protein
MLTEPTPFRFRHGRPKGIFPLESRVLQCMLRLDEPRNRLGVFIPLRKLARQRHEKTESILQIVELGLPNEPLPIQVRVRQRSREAGSSVGDFGFCRFS